MINIDKLIHFLIGAAIAFPVCWFSSPRVAILAVMFVAAVKEIYDSRHTKEHTFDGLDFVSTVVGGLTGIAML